MRTLIIPDLHHHVKNAERWIGSDRFDRVVFLGDYFDDFGDDVSDAIRTATWLRTRIESTEDIFLLGNHDVAYMAPASDELYCPGFTKAKAWAINEILEPRHWLRFRLAHEEQGWLLIHAGFHPALIENPTIERILHRCDQALERARRRQIDPILGIGEDRGGLQRVGGPLWLDWSRFTPIPGINQIVGHTPGTEVRTKTIPESANYCIDVRNASVAALLTACHLQVLGER